MKLRMAGVLIAFLFLCPALSWEETLLAQQPCPAPPIAASSKEPNIFSEQQEMDLGDAIAEQVQRSFRVIEDEDIVGHLQRLADGLARHLPASKMRYRVFLVDLPMVNAFGFPGGRIYVTRKLVAGARTEDEVAGVVAHEIGHIVTRQSAQDMSALFRDVLGVTQMGDRKDVFDKFHQLIEGARLKKGHRHSDREERQEQLEADHVALYASAAAGYSPQAYADFWNRAFDVKGKTGNWFSEAFGFTKPEAKRLREMLKLVSSLPPACMGSRTGGSAQEFEAWKAAVVAYTGLGRKESLGAVLARRSLEPPLGGELNHLRFSPDGQWALAQDDSSIYVLSRQPFEARFRIDASEAYPARFAPDSKSLVFYTPSLRVEKWSLEDEERTEIHEVVLQRGCWQSALSPDGNTLACLGGDNFDLILFEVATGQEFFRKKSFFVPDLFQLFFFQLMASFREPDDPERSFNIVGLEFSSDGRYILAGRKEVALAVDLTTRAAVPVPGSVKRLMVRNFTFLGPDRLAGAAGNEGEKSGVVTFPEGQPVVDLRIGGASLTAPGHGNYVLLRPIDKYALGVMDLSTKKIFMANRKEAFDIYDRLYIGERRNGEVGLYSADSTTPLSVAQLPRGPMGRIRAVAVSRDLNWLAVSERNRGAVWDLGKGKRVFYTRGFRGAYFDGAGALFADYPEFEKDKRGIARMDLTRAQIVVTADIEEKRATQFGKYLLVRRPAKKDGRYDQNIHLDVKEAATGKLLWSRLYPREAPWVHLSSAEDSLAMIWTLSEKAAKEYIKQEPEMTRRLAAMKEKEGDYYVQVLEPATGKQLGQLLIETGKGAFRITNVLAVGDRVIISDSQNRVLVYSLQEGAQRGRLFGGKATASGKSNLLCIENEKGQLTLYDLASLEKRKQYTFASPVSWAQFSADGQRLFVLTDDQTAFTFDVGAASGTAQAGPAPRSALPQ